MRFHKEKSRFPALVVVILLEILPIYQTFDFQLNDNPSGVPNNITFHFTDIDECGHSEYYDLDTFGCVACAAENNAANLQGTANKFSCECTPNSITSALYDAATKGPICVSDCSDFLDNTGETTGTCAPTATPNTLTTPCKFKLINSTTSASGTRTTRIINAVDDSDNCHECDLTYNFRYQDYCIVNELLKPYLKYNSYWQSTTTSNDGFAHFGNLKFVAFFCLALHNATACNQLTNLCVQSHYSADKHSPCSAFLLTQVADGIIKYASMDDHLQATRPFLYFRKGKQTAELLTKPLTRATITSKLFNRLQFFSTVYALDGTLQRMGTFRLNDLNLCQKDAANDVLNELATPPELQFAQYTKSSQCKLRLETLLDLAQLPSNNNFVSLFLNVSSVENTGNDASKTHLQVVPILIEDLTAENSRSQSTEWQLVKRFQLIGAQPRHISSHDLKPKYRDEHKVLLFRRLRYAERITIVHKIRDDNRLTMPLMKLRYRFIELSANSTLESIHPFQFQISFSRGDAADLRHSFYKTALLFLLAIALLMALMRTYGQRKRRATTAAASYPSTSPTATDLWCGVSSCLREFLLLLISYASNAMLLCFLLYAIVYPVKYLWQRQAEITLPIMRNDAGPLAMLIYTAFLLKFLYLCVQFWRISHLDLFLIDWERPRSFEHNHFTLKGSNPETSSVCSSVRTFASENNVSTWRVFFAINDWIRLCVKQRHSTMLQGLLVLIIAQHFIVKPFPYDDLGLRLFVIILCSFSVYSAQRLCEAVLLTRLFGDPLQKFMSLCSLANVSVLVLLSQSYGFYIHGRSPNGFADTDMYSMLIQLQRDSQNRCSRKGLLGDSDQQSYIILTPMNLRSYCEKLLAPLQRSHSISQAHFQKEINNIDATIERSSAANSGLNRFLCAFIDHAIKDMDYIIKEKTFFEKLFDCEFDNILTENKGTFYIDNAQTFSQLFFYGNDFNIFIMELLLVLAIYMLTANLIVATVAVCSLNKLLKCTFLKWVYQNISMKTSIDRRFLM